MKKLFTIALCTLSGLIFAENMGVRVIQPGGQTHEANIRHQKMCEEMGGVDVTNEGTSTLSTGAIDGVVCDMKDKKNIDKKVLNNKESIVYRQGESYNLSSSNQKIIRFNNLGAAIMHLLAPEETVKYGTNFTAMGVAQYSDFPAGVILSEVAVPVDQCAFGNQRCKK